MAGELTFTQKGAQLRLAQDRMAGKITREQFIKGVGALSRLTVGGGQKTMSLKDLYGQAGSLPASPTTPKQPPTASTKGERSKSFVSGPSVIRTGGLGALQQRRQEIIARIKRNKGTLASLRPL